MGGGTVMCTKLTGKEWEKTPLRLAVYEIDGDGERLSAFHHDEVLPQASPISYF
jgi:hypothetical protein